MRKKIRIPKKRIDGIVQRYWIALTKLVKNPDIKQVERRLMDDEIRRLADAQLLTDEGLKEHGIDYEKDFPEGIKVYHGTDPKLIPQIMKEGLKAKMTKRVKEKGISFAFSPDEAAKWSKLKGETKFIESKFDKDSDEEIKAEIRKQLREPTPISEIGVIETTIPLEKLKEYRKHLHTKGFQKGKMRGAAVFPYVTEMRLYEDVPSKKLRVIKKEDLAKLTKWDSTIIKE